MSETQRSDHSLIVDEAVRAGRKKLSDAEAQVELDRLRAELKCKGEEWAKIFTELRANNDRLVREVECLENLAYIGEHHHPDLSWKSRCLESHAALQHHKHLLEVRDRALEKARMALKEGIKKLVALGSCARRWVLDSRCTRTPYAKSTRC